MYYCPIKCFDKPRDTVKCVNLLLPLLSVQKSFRWKLFTSHFIFTLDFFFLDVLNRDDTFYGWANSAIMESSVIHFCVHSFVSGGIILPGLVETRHRKNTQISKHWPVICMKCNAHLSTILILLTDRYYIELYFDAH